MIVDVPSARRLANDLIVANMGPAEVNILEAGGGSKTKINTSRLSVRSITTIDISAEQLDRNTYADHKIHGDLETYRYSRPYELIVVWDVLEHLRRVDRALDNLAEACADGGLIVVGGPSPRSFKGLVTRFTPHWVHVRFYRHILRSPHAGKPGYAPFETHFHPLAEPGRLRGFLAERGFSCSLSLAYEGQTTRRMGQTAPLASLLHGLVTGLVNAVTPKRYNARHSDFVVIFRKEAPADTA